jgi:16S rRNA (guanine527-N7)-methyltransferase
MASMKLFWDDLPALFPEFARPERWLPLLRLHWELIQAAAPRVSVTTVSTQDAARRHYAESLELLRIAELTAWEGNIADVGSGGGFPGLVIACLLPEVKVELIEPLQKRARLLEDLAAELGLSNVQVRAMRA